MKIIRMIFLSALIIFILCQCGYCEESDFLEKKSTHFIVYYKKGVDVDFITDIIASAEDYYNEIANALGYHRYSFWLWDERANIYIFADKDTYLKETKQPEWSGGCALYQQKKLWTYPHATGFFDSILPHELGHIIFREFVGFGNNIPLWFEEGVASYQEKSKRYAAKIMVKEFMSKSRLFTMEELSSIKSPQDIVTNDVADLFYAEAVSIVYFLINKFDQYRFAALCRNLKEGVEFDEAIDKAYFSIENSQDLYKQWIRYINE